MSKRVFFLGAGFSKAIDNSYPLMNQLTRDIETKISKLSVVKHYNEIAEPIKQDVEALLTYLSTNFPWKSDTTKYSNRSLYEEIIKLISKQFSDLAKQSISQPITNEVSENLANFVCNHLNECNFITLNYDLLLENILLRKLKNINSSINFEDLYKYPMMWIGNRSTHKASWGNYAEGTKPIVPALLKLHGSANWFWAGINPSDNIYYRNWNGNETNNVDMGLKPYIIPPVMDKNSFYNHIAIHSLWQQAENILKEAEEIYIIGFSFPQTDISVKYLFQSALRSSGAKIYIVNPETEQTLRINYDKVFGNNGNVIYEYIGKNGKDYNVVERFIKEHLLDNSSVIGRL